MKMTANVEMYFCAGEKNAKEEPLQIIIIFSVPKRRPDMSRKVKSPSEKEEREAD